MYIYPFLRFSNQICVSFVDVLLSDTWYLRRPFFVCTKTDDFFNWFKNCAVTISLFSAVNESFANTFCRFSLWSSCASPRKLFSMRLDALYLPREQFPKLNSFMNFHIINNSEFRKILERDTRLTTNEGHVFNYIWNLTYMLQLFCLFALLPRKTWDLLLPQIILEFLTLLRPVLGMDELLGEHRHVSLKAFRYFALITLYKIGLIVVLK